MQGLRSIIIQECFDSKGVGQPEIIEKARACEAYGAEVIQLTVGPELFYTLLSVLEDTGYFNASLYSPYGIAGVETLGYEIAMQCREKLGKEPDMVVCTHAGGGMLTGTARGLIKAGCKNTQVVGASIDLTGLHMASDTQFNKKSCTTGHTGFGVPHASDPDNCDTPRSAGRVLRYMDRYVTVKQGDVMYITEALRRPGRPGKRSCWKYFPGSSIIFGTGTAGRCDLGSQRNRIYRSGKTHSAANDFCKT